MEAGGASNVLSDWLGSRLCSSSVCLLWGGGAAEPSRDSTAVDSVSPEPRSRGWLSVSCADAAIVEVHAYRVDVGSLLFSHTLVTFTYFFLPGVGNL